MRTPTLTFARARCTSQRRHPSLAPRLTPTLRLIRYGDKGIPPIIPPSSALQFEVELLSVQVTKTRLTRLEPKPGPTLALTLALTLILALALAEFTPEP